MTDDALARQTWIRGRSMAIAQESYAQFRESYEVEHGVVLAEWTALDDGTQARWRQMFVPVAEQLVQADEAVRAARLLDEEHLALRAQYDQKHARLNELEDVVAGVSRRLPEAALLANLPAPLLAALAPLYNTATPTIDSGAPVGAVPSTGAAGAGSPDAEATSASAPAARESLSDQPSVLVESPGSPEPPEPPELEPPARFALPSPELIAELEAAASAFAAEVDSVKLPLTNETGSQRSRARVRASASQMIVALHKKARDHLLKALGPLLTEAQRATLWPLPDDVFAVVYDVAAILEIVGVTRALDSFEVPPPGDDARSPKAWARVEQVREQLNAAGLADLDEYTDAQLGQVGRVVAEVLGLDVNPAAQVVLGNAGVVFTRALTLARRPTG